MSHVYISGLGANHSSTGVVIGADKLREMVPKIRIPNKNKTRSILEERSAMMRERDAQMAHKLQEETTEIRNYYNPRPDTVVFLPPDTKSAVFKSDVYERRLQEEDHQFQEEEWEEWYVKNVVFENEWEKLMKVLTSSYQFDYSKLDKLEKEAREFVQNLDETLVCFYTIHYLVGSGNGPDFTLYNDLYIITSSNIYKGDISIATYCNGGKLIIGPLNIKPHYNFDKQLSPETSKMITSFCSIIPSTTTWHGSQASGVAERSYSHSKDLWASVMSSIKGTIY
jgi:hypothetical protein